MTNINECMYKIMLVFPKELETIKGQKASYIFANITPKARYSKVSDEDMNKAFADSVKKVMQMYHEHFKGMEKGYKYVFVNLSFNEITKYGTPIFISTDRVNPDRFMAYTVDQAKEYAIQKLKSIKKKQEEKAKDLNQKRRYNKNKKKDDKK